MYNFNTIPCIISKQKNKDNTITNIYNTGWVDILNNEGKEIKSFRLAEEELKKLLEKKYINTK